MHKIQEKYKDEIEDIVYASNLIDNKGYVTSQGGNLSYRTKDGKILITPTKLPKRYIEFNDIVILDMEGKMIFSSKGHLPTGEAPFHIHILKIRPDLNALVHAHPVSTTALAIAKSKLLQRPLLPEPIIEIGPVLSVAYEEPLSMKLAEAFNKVVLKSNAFLMENHGVLVGSGDGIIRATELLEMIEATASSILSAKMLGVINEIPPEGVLKLENVMKTRNLPMPGLPGQNKSLMDLYY